MSSFTKFPPLTLVDDNLWRTEAELTYYVDKPDGDSITVPVGFQTDLASVPRILWNIFPPHGRHAPAAVVHDFLYVNGGKVFHSQAPGYAPVYRVYTKEQADRIFYEAMGVLGVPQWRRWLMWKAVRVGGRGNFDKV